MFKPHIEKCIDCKCQRIVVVKAGRCAYCNHLFKEAKKALKPQPIRRLDKEEKKAVFGSLKKKFRL